MDALDEGSGSLPPSPALTPTSLSPSPSHRPLPPILPPPSLGSCGGAGAGAPEELVLWPDNAGSDGTGRGDEE
jgi:hypothetical protein